MSYFSQFEKVAFEGADTSNPLAFRHYDADRMVMGKSMREHLRWAICYWHTFAWPGADIFGAGTFDRPWLPGQPCTPELAQIKLDAAFDFFSKMGAPFYCFHDVDAMAEHHTPTEYSRELDAIASKMVLEIPSLSEGNTKRSMQRNRFGTSSRLPVNHARCVSPASSSRASARSRSEPPPTYNNRSR